MPVGRIQYCRCRFLIRTGCFDDDAAGADPELFVVGLHIDHQIAVGLAELDHRRRRQGIEDQLLRRTGLHPSRSGDDLRSGLNLNRNVTEPAHGRAPVIGDPDGDGAGGPGGFERTHHVWCPAGGGDTDHGIVCADFHCRQVRCRRTAVVLVTLPRRLHGPRPTSNQYDDETRVSAEGRHTFRRIHEGQPARRACPYVDQPAAAFQLCHDRIHGSGDCVAYGSDGRGNKCVLRGDAGHQVTGRKGVEICKVGPGTFRGQSAELAAETVHCHPFVDPKPYRQDEPAGKHRDCLCQEISTPQTGVSTIFMRG